MGILQILITLTLSMILVIPTGKYLYKVVSGDNSLIDPIMDKFDGLIYKFTGINRDEMDWKKYAIAVVITNLIMALIVYILFRIQTVLGLNPNWNESMHPSIAFNTAISFITNTDLQNYRGESGLTYLTQMIAITFLMFSSATTGFSVGVAFMRGIIGKTKTLGNFFVDFIRITTRIMLPVALIITLLLVWQGVPQTFKGNQTVTTIEGTLQDIPLGPIASLESIKHIGTNGGGFFAANSSHPFENPTPISNLIEILAMMLFPSSMVYMFGLMLKNKRQAACIFISMVVLLLISLPICYFSEKSGNPALETVGLSQSMGNMEGKEVRFGIAQSALFTTITTAFTTGSVNNMHDSLTPLGGMIALCQMMLNVVFGGIGIGFMTVVMYAMLAVFLCGLMVGRTPEFLGKKIEGKEMKLIAITILIHPFIILIPSAIALVTKQGISGISNPGYHGISQVLYEFTSSAANNGSSLAGLGVDSLFWNISTGLVMFFGRFIPIVALLAIAGSMAAKNKVASGMGTFKTDNVLFTFILVAVVLIVGALTFLPALSLSPIADQLTLWS